VAGFRLVVVRRGGVRYLGYFGGGGWLMVEGGGGHRVTNEKVFKVGWDMDETDLLQVGWGLF